MSEHSNVTVPAQPPHVSHITRPWGAFRQYAHNQVVTVSLMIVEPGQRLSLQAHKGRAELWIILDEGAAVEIDGDISHPTAGSELWIPASTKHRLSSTGPVVRVLEVAFGDWQQHDITRYADDFARPAVGE